MTKIFVLKSKTLDIRSMLIIAWNAQHFHQALREIDDPNFRIDLIEVQKLNRTNELPESGLSQRSSQVD